MGGGCLPAEPRGGTAAVIRALLSLIAGVSLLAGCASTWTLAVETAPRPPEWRDEANVLRAAHVESIRGFTETGPSLASALKYAVFGRTNEQNMIQRPVAAAVGADERIAVADAACSCVHLYIPAEQRYRRVFQAGKDELKSPVSVAFDDEARLYVSDSFRAAIFVFDRNGEYAATIREAGGERLRRPTGLAFASAAKLLYALDTTANRVHVFDSSGRSRLSFGEPGEKEGQFNYPTHLAVSSDGDVFIVDAMNFRIQAFDRNGVFRASFGHHGNGSGDFAMPKGIAADRNGVLYIVDTLFDNIQLFDMNGNFLFTLGSRGSGQGEFSMPSGLVLDSRSRLFVCDTYNQRIQVFQVSGDRHE